MDSPNAVEFNNLSLDLIAPPNPKDGKSLQQLEDTSASNKKTTGFNAEKISGNQNDNDQEEKLQNESEESVKIETEGVGNQQIKFEIKDSVDEETGSVEKKLVVSVIDSNTGEVLRQIPPEELQKQLKSLNQLGNLLNQVG